MARESWKNGPSCSGVAKRIPGHRASLLHALYFQAFGKQNLGRKVSPSLYTHKICPSNKIGQTPRTDWNRFKSWRVFILFGAMFYVSVCLRIGYWIPQKLIQFDGLSVIIVLHLRGIPKIYPCIGIPNDSTPPSLKQKGSIIPNWTKASNPAALLLGKPREKPPNLVVERAWNLGFSGCQSLFFRYQSHVTNYINYNQLHKSWIKKYLL